MITIRIKHSNGDTQEEIVIVNNDVMTLLFGGMVEDGHDDVLYAE